VDAFGDSQTYLPAKEYYWKIVSHVPAKILKSSANDLVRNLSFLVIFLVIFIAVLSWSLAQAIVKRKSHQLELFRSASFDQLTGLPNRSLFFERTEQTLKQGHRNERKFALLFLDLDGFKTMNDTLGHDGGDALLKKVAEKLQSCVRESDTAARFGGDEFAIVLTNLISKNDAGLVAGKIIKNLSSPFTIKGKELQIGVSIGIGIFPENGETIDRLLQNADNAMYKVKKKGKNHFQFAINNE
jgi:diguanylate cyclase (GGDEF)-like protein